jgi:hypothetical protein
MADSPAGDDQRLPVKYKIILYVAAWLTALFLTDPTCSFWSLAYLFPLGLAAVLSHQLANDGGWWVLGGGAAVYLVHAYFYFRSKQAKVTWLFFAALILLLIGNVEGCRSMLPQH